jgi:extracellular factor (EF) 3-hydroxypalmitic acid methyl ester biosynthesis protein
VKLAYEVVIPEKFYIQKRTGLEFLDEAMSKLQSGFVEDGMRLLVSELTSLYITTSTTTWNHVLETALLKHPIKDILLQDPLTYRSFTRPRGYAGDAVLIDMIYFPQETDLSSTSSIGQQVYRFNTNTPLSRTLRKRMKLTSDYIDNFTKEHPQANILSVASGHCRELQYSSSIKNGEIARFVALDNDETSLEFMRKQYGDLKIEPAPLAVSDIVKGKAELGKFDLIYSAGLYDYLSNRFAQRLTKQLYDMLTPGGKLMLVNIASKYNEIGYLESYMNWAMIGRNERQTLELATELKTDERATLNVNIGSDICSHYNVLEIAKN